MVVVFRQLAFLVLLVLPVISPGKMIGNVVVEDRLAQLIDNNPQSSQTVILQTKDDSSIKEQLTDIELPVDITGHRQAVLRGRLQDISNHLSRLNGANVVARLPYPHTEASVVSQGVDFTGAGDMQTLSYDGSGIRIGVVDLGFGSYAASQSSGDLPSGSNLVAVDYTGTGITSTTTHGTQVAEIVHDMAPGAKLYLAKIGTDSDLSAAVNDLLAWDGVGADVIVHSVAWFGESFYDGTGALCDIVNTADVGGIVWVNAAGNSRNAHWLGNMTDADADLRHEFATGQNYNSIYRSAGQTFTLILNWDAYPTTSVDYDLYLYDGDPDSSGTLVASSANNQSANGPFWFPYPYEAITHTAATSATYYIVVKKRSSSETELPLTLFSLSGSLDTKVRASSIVQPADCATAIAVAAADLADSPESFSSEGPRLDGYPKPDVTGPDRVVTSLSSSFAGTSAAAPHVAGALALLAQQNPGSSTSALRNMITTSVHDIHSTGYDYRTGSGRISFDADGDGLNHDDELLAGTDPLLADTDNDGVLDAVELQLGLNPLLYDTDGDSFSDGEELLAGSDPLDPLDIPILADGDVNDDGVVDAADVVIVRQYLLNGLSLTQNQLVRADVAPLSGGVPSSDGDVNLGDLYLIQKKAAGSITY